MKNINKLSTIISAILIMASVNAQDTSIPKFNTDFKVSANIVAGCYLSADNLNFGTLITPITNQTTSSEMRVHCSKNAPYQVSIYYSNVGSESNSGEYTYGIRRNGANSATNKEYKIYKNGVPISSAPYDVDCYNTSADLQSAEAIVLYGATSLITNDSALINSIPTTTMALCNSDATLNVTTFNSVTGGAGGTLKGMIAGEKINYSLELPNQSSTIWNQYNKYSASGNGIEQAIIMKANIKASGNPTYRMTPDTYQDVLTAQLEF